MAQMRTERRTNQQDGRRPAGRGPRNGAGPRGAGPRGAGPRGAGPRSGPGFRKKQNRFFMVFAPGQIQVDYKDTEKLSRFLTEKGKIIPRRITGLTAKQQRILAGAIKRARHAGLLAFQVE